MKLNNVKNLGKLMEMVDKCEGDIELVTSEGDRLNLKSQLSRLVILSGLFNQSEIPEMEVICHNPDDVAVMFSYMLNNCD